MDADTIMNSPTGLGTSSGTSTTSSEFIRFNPDTRPGFLERESSMLEVLTWIEQAVDYIKSGFRNNPPAVGCHIYLAPLINSTWLQNIESKGGKGETLEGIITLIRIEGETRNPVHLRRIQLLKVKKTSSHSEFLQKLEKIIEVCEWEKMSKDEFLIHMFAESADQTKQFA